MIPFSPIQDWCKENFINSKNMMLVAEVRAQLRDICLKVFFLSSCSLED